MLCCFLCVFAVYCPHPDLHSFPTRRSSDLAAARDPERIGRIGLLDADADVDAPLAHQPIAQLRRGDEAAFLAGHRRDRKSTRLNSSHLGISYAVFCLKKKK